MKALIDGDIILYRACSGATTITYDVMRGKQLIERFHPGDDKGGKKAANSLATAIGGDILTVKDEGPVENTLHLVAQSLETIVDDLGIKDVQVYLSDPDHPTFRHDLATIRPYKGNRTEEKPTHLGAAKDYLLGVWGAKTALKVEADDLLGIEVTSDPENTILCSCDKDLNQIAGYHYDFTTKNRYQVSELYARRMFYRQLLTGDSTDNIVGIPKVGAKTAQSALKGLESDDELLEACMDMYANAWAKGLFEELTPMEWEDILTENARLVYILRKGLDERWEIPKEMCTRGNNTEADLR